MKKHELAKFIEWLSLNIDEFKDNSPEETVSTLNATIVSPNGNQKIENWINEFKQTTMAKLQGGGLIEKLFSRKTKTSPSTTVVYKVGNDRLYSIDTLKNGNRREIIERLKDFNGKDIISPDRIFTAREISPNKDTIIYSVVHKNAAEPDTLYSSNLSGITNKANGQKFNPLFDQFFKNFSQK